MKKHISLYKKMLTIVLSFAMIAGFWGGITLDARALAADVSFYWIAYKDNLNTVIDRTSIKGNSSIEVMGINGYLCKAHVWVMDEKKNDYSSTSPSGSDTRNGNGESVVFDLSKIEKINKDSDYDVQIELKQENSSTYNFYIYLTKVQEQTQTVSNIAITVPQPVGGQALPSLSEVTYTVTGAKVTKILWCKGDNTINKPYEKGDAEYNTVYTMTIRYEAEDGYKFNSSTAAWVNGIQATVEITGGSKDKVCWVTYTFPATEAEQTQTISNIAITAPEPVGGQKLPGFPIVTQEITGAAASGIWWYEGADASGTNMAGNEAKYNTVYTMRIRYEAKAGYTFDSNTATTVNGSNAKFEVISGTNNKWCYVTYTFPATGTEPSGGDYKIIEGNNSNYVPGSDKPLSFRGDGDYDKFLRVEVDGNPVTPTDYTVREGSTIITFEPYYLETLGNGKHTIVMFWDINGTAKYAEGSFYIGENGGEIVPGNVTQPGNKPEQRHTCNFQWTMTLDPSVGMDGLEEYKCIYCGAVQESHAIPAGIAYVKELYGDIKNAPKNGSVTYDAGKLYTISDYLLKKMAERNDVAVTIKFEYQNKKYQLTFPAGLDYRAVLTDEETMYGYFGVAAKLGLKVVEQ